jgi:hypothetical protein
MASTIHILSFCGILMFGVGGFMLISGLDTGKPPLITRVAAGALLAIGFGLFVTGILKS